MKTRSTTGKKVVNRQRSPKQEQAVNLIFGGDLAKSILAEADRPGSDLNKIIKAATDIKKTVDDISKVLMDTSARQTRQEIKQGFETHMGATFFPAQKKAKTGVAGKMFVNGYTPTGLAAAYFSEENN